MHSQDNITQAAEVVFSARQGLCQTAPIQARFALDNIEQAYAVQNCNTERWLAEGRKLTGRKIGLTSKAVQAQIGVDQPDFGMLWGDYAFSNGDLIDSNKFMQPKAEVEIAFVMGKKIENPQASLSDLISAIEYSLASIEIVDSAIENWAISLMDTVADNASSGGYVLGTHPKKLTGSDLRLAGALISKNGRQASFGVGAVCMEHPLNAALWLARKMAALQRPLEEGDLILSGALGPMVDVSPGDVFCIEISGYDPLNISFGQKYD